MQEFKTARSKHSKLPSKKAPESSMLSIVHTQNIKIEPNSRRKLPGMLEPDLSTRLIVHIQDIKTAPVRQAQTEPIPVNTATRLSSVKKPCMQRPTGWVQWDNHLPQAKRPTWELQYNSPKEPEFHSAAKGSLFFYAPVLKIIRDLL
ncbi:MAG: hypothetical protein H8E46_10700 [FCB group bacterium]|nr:hypothetical protein [FCB group bacterium]